MIGTPPRRLLGYLRRILCPKKAADAHQIGVIDGDAELDGLVCGPTVEVIDERYDYLLRHL